jgi:hypothetical protein
VAETWRIPVWVGDAFSYPLVVNEFGREDPRLDADALGALADYLLGVPELEFHRRGASGHRKRGGRPGPSTARIRHAIKPKVEDVIARWVAMSVQEFRVELAAAADGRRRVALDPYRVDRFARIYGPPHRYRLYRRGKGPPVWAQVAESLAQRVAAELVDFVRLAPQLSHCPRCGRVRVGHCGAYLARDGLIVETCDGRTSPAPSDERRRRKRTLRGRVERAAKRFGPASEEWEKARNEYLQEFPLEKRGPPERVPRSNILAEDPPASAVRP